jgi:hypothetical protein
MCAKKKKKKKKKFPFPEDESEEDGGVVLESETCPVPQCEWTDVSMTVARGCSSLDFGAMVCRTGFSLLEAISGIEIMDPKVDSGMDPAPGVLASFEEAIEAGLFEATLPLERMIGVMDELVALEATYWSGNSLPQTVFTCLLLHAPEGIDCPVMRAFVMALIRSCSVALTAVMHARIADEEDWVSHAFELDLCDDVPREAVAEMLIAAEAELAARARAPETTRAEAALVEALLARIALRRAVYSVLVTLAIPEGAGLSQARTWAREARRLVGEVAATASLGVASPSLFQPSINKRRMAPLPPRAAPQLALKEALALVDKTMSDLEVVTSAPESIGSLDSLKQFMVDFSARDPGCLARSYFAAIVFVQGAESHDVTVLRRWALVDLVADDMAKYSAPGGDGEQSQGSSLVAAFAAAVATAVAVLARAFCSNRARQRRRLVNALESLRNLQEDAYQLDVLLSPEFGPPKSTIPASPRLCYTYALTLRVGAHILALGFELELYQLHDHLKVFHYLEALFGQYTTFLARQEPLALKRSAAALAGAAAAAGEGGQPQAAESIKRLENRVKELEAGAEPTENPTYLYSKGMFLLSKGMTLLLVALERMGLVREPTFPFGSPEVRYRHSFEGIFSRVSFPVLVSYKAFSESCKSLSQPQFTPELLLKGAAHQLTLAKEALQAMAARQDISQALAEDMAKMAKAASANAVSANLIIRQTATAPPDGQMWGIKPDWVAHKHLPVYKATAIARKRE